MQAVFLNKPPALKLYNSWHNLKGKTIKNQNVILSSYNDIQPFTNSPIFLCDNLIIYKCDVDFVYYWINKRTFPNAKRIYLDSPPYDLQYDYDYIYLHEKHKQYREWFKNIVIVDDESYKQLLNNYENEPLQE